MFNLQYTIASIMLLIGFGVCGQNAEADFIRINEAYLKSPAVSFKTKYAFEDASGKIASANELGDVYISKRYRYFKSQGIETIENETLKLVVNHLEKRISILPIGRNETFQETMSSIDVGILSQTLKTATKVKFEKAGLFKSAYSLEIDDNDLFNRLNIVFNNKTYLLERMEFVKDSDPKNESTIRLVVDCLNTRIDKKANMSRFDLSQFITIKTNKITAATRYKNYDVANLYSTKIVKK